MRITIILLLIILAMTACASRQPAAPIVHPLPIPIQDDTPVPVDTAATEVPSGVPTDVSSGTATAPCTCLAGTTTPAQPQGEVTSAPTVLCNCPANIVPPPLPGQMGGSTTPQAIPTNGISMSDDGKTFILHPGESFLLNLGTDVFDWTVNIDNQSVLAREKNVMVIQGAQGIYQANNPGQAVLTAIGKPHCQQSKTVCMALVILFKITVIVQ